MMRLTHQNYSASDRHDPWRLRYLGPQQLLVSDVHYSTNEPSSVKAFEVKEYVPSDLVNADVDGERLQKAADMGVDGAEATRLIHLEKAWGWMSDLRLRDKKVEDDVRSSTCRWIHVSSTFPKYIAGFLWALSDLDAQPGSTVSSLRRLDEVIEEQERFSKHGKHFAPFVQTLKGVDSGMDADIEPILICMPFLDWSVQGRRPPLRFQIDKSEGRTSVRSSRHPLRSILQHFYRLEETQDREKDQVFSRHRPWTTDRDLDLRVRSWYGQYPSALVVDELWILVVDERHIVTFSNNQTWKSVFPPLQLPFRIKNDAFRAYRSSPSPSFPAKPALTHVFICLDAALGLLHRSFWQDIVLCLSDRYASYLGHLQYRIYRAPNTRLVMDLLQVQEELNIVVKLIEQQLSLVQEISSLLSDAAATSQMIPPSPLLDRSHTQASTTITMGSNSVSATRQYRAMPGRPLITSLSSELRDLQELSSNTDALLTRTIQLVNIRLEDHGKAILVFTIVTIIFLPLNFVSSFFGMNVSDIRNLDRDQRVFWTVAACVTVGTVGLSLVLAFSGGKIMESLNEWWDARKKARQRGMDGRVNAGNPSLSAPFQEPTSFWRRLR